MRCSAGSDFFDKSSGKFIKFTAELLYIFPNKGPLDMWVESESKLANRGWQFSALAPEIGNYN